MTTAINRIRPRAKVLLWAGQVVLAVQFAMAGAVKLAGDPASVGLFEAIGAGQWFRYLVGALEIAAAIGLLVPRLCRMAALGLVGLMAGAVVTSVAILHADPWLPLALGTVAGLIAWGRR
ncbi:DoxX family membrane protein [Nonomuraea turkmeniaca]|uniref:DoxX family membrane protein n=1 Tax=Nonomuraea turkmeniaca TaxID=103838 RepID=A0A5S4EZL6_9ACTN|nr:DoxX family protein [Nonomuraea turkmeniaca]TMR09147.1 DoxX family membrane protein [Nonomuraea turkmeniaca]